MFAKYSVRKPFTVLVCAIIVLMLGAVALRYMKTDLLPQFEVPYLAVITTDPGASPEQVETEVTDVLESALGSMSGVKELTSISAENYSMIFLEFADDTDMDGALVKASAAANSVSADLPETAGTPYYMEMSMDMIASMYLGVTSDEGDMAKLTQTVDDNVIPALERLDGVADVSASGSVIDSIDIKLNQHKIDNVNDGILGEVNDKFAEAQGKIDDAEAKLDRAERKLENAQKKLDAKSSKAKLKLENQMKKARKTLAKQQDKALSGFDDATNAVNQALVGKAVLTSQQATLQAQMQTLQPQIDALEQLGMGESEQAQQLKQQMAGLQQASDELAKQIEQVDAGLAKTEKLTSSELAAVLGLAQGSSQMDVGELKGEVAIDSGISQAQQQITQGLAQIQTSRAQLKQSKAELKAQRKEARSQANIDQMVDKTTLAQLIKAQNFEMPAGYVTDAKDEQWLVKVGEEYDSISQLKSMVLTKIDGVGDITLGDVADVTTSNTLGESYAKLNGSDGIILSLTKMSTANTTDVSKQVNAQLGKIEQANPGVHVIPIMDQGVYIDLIIGTVLKSLLLGAALAVVVLAVFLKNLKPTLVVAFSIPFSVLFALVIMYFFGLTINIMTLGALSLAIGMLVDNSIVVMENIYRMRARGISATRAAAQGAVQVGGAIFASTLTSICVFFPFVFTTGTVRQLMVPFALTISFALLASLVVALTVVPALSASLFKKAKPAEIKWFQHVQNGYAKVLDVCLNHKAPVLLLAVALFGVALALVVNMGIVMIPETTSSQIGLIAEMPEDMEKEDAYELMDVAGSRLANLDGAADVGIADNSTTAGTMMGSMTSGGDLYSGRFMIYVTIDKEKITTEQGVKDLQQAALDATSDLDCTVTSSNDTSSMSSFAGGDAEVEISGTSRDQVQKLARKVVKVVESVEGYEEVSDGQEDADPTLHLYLDKDKIARKNATVAQVYQQIAAALKENEKAFELRYHGKDVDVSVYSKDGEVKKKDLLDLTYTDNAGGEHKLSKVATVKKEPGVDTIMRVNSVYSASVTADVADGYNITLLARELQPKLDEFELPEDCKVEIAGTNETIQDMLEQMALLAILGFILVYLVMVAQFQSLLLPFIIIFTVPLAFTGGLFSLFIANEQISMMALLGFVILMGTVLNNGIVFVDYVNQMRLDGMAKRAALIVTGKARMRPIIMTALTTIIAMGALIFSQEIGASMERGMALVVAGGLLYATFMTLFVVPAIYDIFCRKPLRKVDIGSDVDDDADDAERYMEQMGEGSRETYEYESFRQRRKRKRESKRKDKRYGQHSELNDL